MKLFQGAWQRFTGGNEVARAALRAAYSNVSDEQAAWQLRDIVASNTASLRAALRLFAEPRDRFDMDRAYRLLDAAMNGGPVQPIPEERRELFQREESLGRMPLADAFTFLADHEPRLRECATASEANLGASQSHERRRKMTVWEVLGVDGHGDPLCKTELARSIAVQYLGIVDGSRSGDSSLSYFALPGKVGVLSTRFTVA